MANIVRSLLFLSLLVTSSFSTPTPPPCSTHHFPDHETFAACNDLPVLNSTVYWNYFPSNGTVDLAFRATLFGDSGWVAWAINPSSKGMVGSQALVSFQRSDGTMAVYTSPIKSYGTSLDKGNLTFPVYTLSAVYDNKDITIFATLGLPNNVTTVNQLWQQGPLHGDTPGIHKMSGPYLKSYGTLDFLSGKVEVTGAHHSMLSPMKIAHAVLNTVGWGVLLPVGGIVARNLKMFDPWYHLHLICQISGLTLGGFGFITGYILGYQSPGIQYKGHECIGWTLLVLGVVQGMVAYLKPGKGEKDRWLWVLFHIALGYTLIILGQVNIFKGFDILEPPKPLKDAYIGYLALLLSIGAGSACYTQWKNKKRTQAAKTESEQSGEGIV